MEITKVEIVAVAEVAQVAGQDQMLVLTDFQLALVGGGQGDIHLG